MEKDLARILLGDGSELDLKSCKACCCKFEKYCKYCYRMQESLGVASIIGSSVPVQIISTIEADWSKVYLYWIRKIYRQKMLL